MPNQRQSQLTDALLRDEIAHGLNAPAIAAKYGLTKQAVYKRINRMELTATALTVLVPAESHRYFSANINAMNEVTYSLSKVRLLMDACDAWLRDAKDPTKYDIGPRANEVIVTYLENDGEGGQVKAQAKLSDLLNRLENGGMLAIRGETKHADPRELILKTAQETRQTITQAVELVSRIAEVKAMQAFRESLLEEINKVAPDVAARIAKAIQPVLIVHTVTG